MCSLIKMPKVCRTCLKEITSVNFISISDSTVTTSLNSVVVKQELAICIPELDLKLVANPVVCNPCVNDLHAAYDFKRKCLQTEERIQTYVQSSALETTSVDLSQVIRCNNENERIDDDFSLTMDVKIEPDVIQKQLDEDLDNSYGSKLPFESTMECIIKTDPLSTFTHSNEAPVSSDQDLEQVAYTNFTFSNQQAVEFLPEHQRENPDGTSDVTSSTAHEETSFKCAPCDYSTSDTRNLMRQTQSHTVSENSEESEFSCTPLDVFEIPQKASINSLPEKSRALYGKQYDIFTGWCKVKKIKRYTENVLLAYFSEKSKVMKPSTLWAMYSMLKSTLALKNDIDISKFDKLSAFLKQKAVGYRPKKSKSLKRDEINKFLVEAPDERYLMMKVVLIMGVAGACRRDELVKMTIDDIEDKGSILIVKIPDSKTKVQRIFTVDDENSLGFLSIYRRYAALRPSHISSRRLFINYRNGNCTAQVVGINTIGKIPSCIAQYLKLPDSSAFTGHCFRRSSARLLANSGADITILKRHGVWKSSTIAKEYMDDSIENKVTGGQ